MKKLMALLMALCMGCMLIPAMAEGNSPVGSWYLFSAETQGMTLSVDGIGLSMVITLNEDGTCTLDDLPGITEMIRVMRENERRAAEAARE